MLIEMDIIRMKLNNSSGEDHGDWLDFKDRHHPELSNEALGLFLPLFFIIIPCLFILAVSTVIATFLYCRFSSHQDDQHHQPVDEAKMALSIINLYD